MKVRDLVFQEIRHRKSNFLLALLSVAVAVACLIGSLTLLDAHEFRTGEILKRKQQDQKIAIAKKQAEVARAVNEKKDEVLRTLNAKRAAFEKEIAKDAKEVQIAGKKLQNEMRKITKNLGFNILILPANQDLNELNTEGTLSKTMPESLVARLSNSKIMTVNHLLPMLTHKLEWDGPKKKQTILVIGTRGEVPILHRDPKKPLQGGNTVPKGTLVAGFEVQKQQQLKKGDKVKLLGKEFTVGKLYSQRGTTDDSTVWINLGEAQTALGKQNLVNAILALECNCSTADRLGEIRKDIAKILPGTQVIEGDSRKALARAEARSRAKTNALEALNLAKKNGAALLKKSKEAGDQLLDQEKKAGAAAILRERKNAAADLKRETESRATLQEQRRSFASILVPLVIAGCAVWIGLLTFGNVRQRSAEIGILRTLGLQSGQIMSLFLSKSLLIAVVGAVIGYLAGFGIGWIGSELPATSDTGAQLFVPALPFLAVGLAIALSGLSSWLPAMFAARQDPAVVLQGD